MKKLLSLFFSFRTWLTFLRMGAKKNYIHRAFYVLRAEIIDTLILRTHLNSPTDVAEFFGARHIGNLLNGMCHATNSQILELYAKHPSLPVNLWYLTEPNEISEAFLSWTVRVWDEELFSLGIQYKVEVAPPYGTEIVPVILRIGLNCPGRTLDTFPLKPQRDYVLSIPRSDESDVMTARVLEPWLFEIWFRSVRFGIIEKEEFYLGQLLRRSRNVSARHVSFIWQSAREVSPETRKRNVWL